MFGSVFIALQHSFMFKYQVDKEKYVKFLIPIHKKIFNIGLPIERYFFLTYGEAIIWPIVPPPPPPHHHHHMVGKEG